MHVTTRMVRVTGGRLPDAIPAVNHITELLNERHGSNVNVAVQIGGDPSVIGFSGMWQSLADLEAYRASAMADTEIASLMRMAAPLFADEVEDTLWKVHLPPGERQSITVVTGALMNLTRVGEAAAFAAEAAGVVSAVTGNQVGIATAATGERARLIWVGFAPDLAKVEADTDALEASDDYMELFKKSEDVMVTGSLYTGIWQSVSD